MIRINLVFILSVLTFFTAANFACAENENRDGHRDIVLAPVKAAVGGGALLWGKNAFDPRARALTNGLQEAYDRQHLGMENRKIAENAVTTLAEKEAAYKRLTYIDAEGYLDDLSHRGPWGAAFFDGSQYNEAPAYWANTAVMTSEEKRIATEKAQEMIDNANIRRKRLNSIVEKRRAIRAPGYLRAIAVVGGGYLVVDAAGHVFKLAAGRERHPIPIFVISESSRMGEAGTMTADAMIESEGKAVKRPPASVVRVTAPNERQVAEAAVTTKSGG